MTALLAGAALILVKITCVALIVFVADVVLHRRRSNWNRAFALLPAMLIVLPAASMVMPSWSSAVVQLPHAMLDAPVSTASPLSWAVLLAGVWIVGVVYSLARLGRSWLSARRIVRSASSQNDAGLRVIASRAARAIGYDRTLPQLVFSADVQSPAVLGWRKPVILLPTDAAAWPEEELFGVLCHELTHVAQGDWLCHFLEEIAAALYWPNPIVRLLWRRTSLHRELAADRAALAAGAVASDYANRLIAVARACTREQLRPGLAFGSSRRNDLSVRVKALFAAPSPGAGRGGFGATAMVVGGTLMLAAAQPIECFPAPPPTPSFSQTCPR